MANQATDILLEALEQESEFTGRARADVTGRSAYFLRELPVPTAGSPSVGEVPGEEAAPAPALAPAAPSPAPVSVLELVDLEHPKKGWQHMLVSVLSRAPDPDARWRNSDDGDEWRVSVPAAPS